MVIREDFRWFWDANLCFVQCELPKNSDLSLGLQWSPFTGRGWIVLLCFAWPQPRGCHEVGRICAAHSFLAKKNYGKRNGPIFDYFLQLSLCQRCSSKDGVSFSILFSSSIQFVWRCLASCSSYFHIGNSVLSIPALPWGCVEQSPYRCGHRASEKDWRTALLHSRGVQGWAGAAFRIFTAYQGLPYQTM
jgi:hypothetical protein